MHSFINFVFCWFFISEVVGIMIKRICPMDETHKSCTFFEDYVCWMTEKRFDRVKATSKRLTHCISGCFCKKGYIRDYPGGGCIAGAGCVNHNIRTMLYKLPANRGFDLGLE